MPSVFDRIKINTSFFETPFTIRQVETHLIFGPIARRIPLAYVMLGGLIIDLVVDLCDTQQPVGQRVGSIFDHLFWLIAPLLFLRMTKRQQAIIGWFAVKFAMGFGALIMATVGSGVSFQHGYADAWPNLFLGLIWIPGVEFIPKVTPHQKYVTLARIGLSIPCIYFGVKSGNWHWG